MLEEEKEIIEETIDGMTDAEREAIAQEAMDEYDLEKMTPEEREQKTKDKELEVLKTKEEEENKTKEEAVEKEEELLNKEDDTLTDEEKQQKETIKKTRVEATKKRILDTDDSELSEEELVVKKELIDKPEEKEKKENPDTELDISAEEIKSVSEKEKITEEEAKTLIIDKNKKIVEKYGNNALKLAHGYRNLQSETSRVQQELKNTQAQLQDVHIQAKDTFARKEFSIADVKAKIQNGGFLDDQGNVISEEHIVDGTRKSFPSVTKNMEDEDILEYASERILDAQKRIQEKMIHDMGSNAAQRREEMLTNLPETDKEFEANIKAVLKETPDERILSSDFKLDYVIHWAKGQKYDNLKKEVETKVTEAFEKGKKQGEESAKVLGIKDALNTISSNKGTGTKKYGRTLSDKEKLRARQMFDGSLADENEMYKSYIEIYPEGEKGVKT